MTKHQSHVENNDYDFAGCEICLRILARARANHDEHTVDGIKHTNVECVNTYRRYAERMSRS